MNLETYLNKYQEKNALKYLEDVTTARKTLKYSGYLVQYDKCYQVLTNSYSIIWLDKHLDLPVCPENLQYPKTDRFFNEYGDIEIEIDLNKLYELSKKYRKRDDKTKFCKINNGNEFIYFNIKLLMNTIKVLGTSQVTVYASSHYKPIIINDINSRSKCLILPIRTYSNSVHIVDITKEVN